MLRPFVAPSYLERLIFVDGAFLDVGITMQLQVDQASHGTLINKDARQKG